MLKKDESVEANKNEINKHSCKPNHYSLWLCKKRSSLILFIFNSKICLISNVCGFLRFAFPYSVSTLQNYYY